MRHITRGHSGWIATGALLVSLAAGCAQTTQLPASNTPLPPTSLPVVTATRSIVTQKVPPTKEECTEVAGSLQSGVYRGIAVAQDIPYNLYLPPCYDAQDQPYPTLYLLHGYPFDEAHWQNLGATEMADHQIVAERWPPFILVMPLLPEPLFRGSDGGPGSYEAELLEGLVPFIEKNFRSDRSARALAGISRGAVWALEVAFRNPHEFNSVAALSPALAVNSARPPYDPFEIVANSDRFPREILLLAGDADWAAVETERFSQVLSDAGVEHTFRITVGDHSNETWAAAMSEVLGFLAVVAKP